MKYIIIAALVVLGFGGLILMSPKSNSSNSAPSLSIQTVQKDVAAGGQLIDVRTAAEYAAGHIDGAINLPVEAIQAGALPAVAKTKPVYVYCHSGNRAGQATIVLKAAGYQNITDLGAMTHVQSIGGIIKK